MAQSERSLGIEQHSIDFVPESERHGRVDDQGPFWFVSNFQFFAIALGFIGPSLGLSLGYTVLAGGLGIVIGTTFQAFHASQGPELGLPQMIQSRAQFGYRGVIVPLLATLVSVLGYNVVSTVLAAEGLHGLWSIDRGVAAVGVSLLATIVAIWGYDWLHRVFKILFWVSLPLFSVLSLAILFGKAGGPVQPGVGLDRLAAGVQRHIGEEVPVGETLGPAIRRGRRLVGEELHAAGADARADVRIGDDALVALGQLLELLHAVDTEA